MFDDPRTLEEMAEEIRRFREFLGEDAVAELLERYAQMVSLVERQPWRRVRLIHANPLAEGLWALAEAAADRQVWGPHAYAVAHLCVAWCDLLGRHPEIDHDICRSRLLDDDPVPIIQEILIASHFERNGFHVTPTSLVSNESPDLLVATGQARIGVEIKVFGPSTGRKVGINEFNRLGEELFRQVTDRGPFLVTVQCRDRLWPADIMPLATRLTEAIASRLDLPAFQFGDYKIAIDRAMPRTVSDAQRQIRTLMDRHEGTHVAFWEAPFGAADRQLSRFRVLACLSEREDTVPRALQDRIGDAATQLDPALPGIVVIHFREQIDWTSFTSPNTIEVLATRAFDRKSTRNVGALVFSSEPPLKASDGLIRLGAPAYVFTHPEADHPVPDSFFETLRSRAPRG